MDFYAPVIILLFSIVRWLVPGSVPSGFEPRQWEMLGILSTKLTPLGHKCTIMLLECVQKYFSLSMVNFHKVFFCDLIIFFISTGKCHKNIIILLRVLNKCGELIYINTCTTVIIYQYLVHSGHTNHKCENYILF